MSILNGVEATFERIGLVYSSDADSRSHDAEPPANAIR